MAAGMRKSMTCAVRGDRRGEPGQLFRRDGEEGHRQSCQGRREVVLALLGLQRAGGVNQRSAWLQETHGALDHARQEANPLALGPFPFDL